MSGDFIPIEFIKTRFNEFFNLYPRKHGKPKAEKEYIKLFTKLKTEQEIITLSSKILDGLKLAVNYWSSNKTEVKYIKLPSNWLIEELWLDTYEPSSEAAASDVPINPRTGEPYPSYEYKKPTQFNIENCSYSRPLAEYIKKLHGVMVRITEDEE